MKLLTNAKFRSADLASLGTIAQGLEVVREIDPEKAREQFRDADIFCGFHLPGPLEEAERLQWIQLITAGAEHLFHTGIMESPIVVTTASGVHARAISEYVLGSMVMLSRRLPQIVRDSAARKWRPNDTRFYYGEELAGKTVGVLGMGAIGARVAKLCDCMEMKVIGLRRHAAPSDGFVTYPPDRLMEMLPECDFVVIALPLTDETRGMIGEQAFRAMKNTAYLVNIARGQIVDEAALVRALREGWIAGAASDVFVHEPLPAESELWDLPNLVITPHMSGNFSGYLKRVMDILRENLRRFVAGEPMINVLDKQRGY